MKGKKDMSNKRKRIALVCSSCFKDLSEEEVSEQMNNTDFSECTGLAWWEDLLDSLLCKECEGENDE